MNNRKHQLKKYAEKGAMHVGKFFLFASAATNAYIAFAPDIANSRTCEAAQQGLNPNQRGFLNVMNATFIVDMGIYIFLVNGVIRSIVIPVEHWAAEKIYQCYKQSDDPLISKETLDILEELEKASITSLNTLGFMQCLPLDNKILNNIVSAFCGVPLIEIAGKKIKNYFDLNQSHENAYIEKIRQSCHHHLPGILEGLNNLGIVTTAASTARSAVNWGLNWFYNSTRENDWPGQNITLDFVLAGTALIALGLVLKSGETLDFFLKQIIFCVGAFITITNVTSSIYFCANTSAESIDRFWQTNLIPFFLICTVGVFATYFRKLELKPEPKNESILEDVISSNLQAHENNDLQNTNIASETLPINIHQNISVANFGTFSKSPDKKQLPEPDPSSSKIQSSLLDDDSDEELAKPGSSPKKS